MKHIGYFFVGVGAMLCMVVSALTTPFQAAYSLGKELCEKEK